MKRLNDYILEQQQDNSEYFINESGLRDTLFGSIVMKLLDTGLSWIEKGVGWMADTLKDAAAGAWESLKGVSKKTVNAVMEEVRKRGKVDKKHKDPLSAYVYAGETPEERAKRAKEVQDIMKEKGMDDNQSAEWLVRQLGPTLLITKYDMRARKADRAKAEKLLEEMKTKYPKLYAKYIEPEEEKMSKNPKIVGQKDKK